MARLAWSAPASSLLLTLSLTGPLGRGALSVGLSALCPSVSVCACRIDLHPMCRSSPAPDRNPTSSHNSPRGLACMINVCSRPSVLLSPTQANFLPARRQQGSKARSPSVSAYADYLGPRLSGVCLWTVSTHTSRCCCSITPKASGSGSYPRSSRVPLLLGLLQFIPLLSCRSRL